MDYILNKKNKIRYCNNVAAGVYYLQFTSRELIFFSENEEIIWNKKFESNIKIVSQEIGNFGNISELITVELENEVILKYSTNGSLIYQSRNDTYFDNYYEEFKAPALVNRDVSPGLYNVKCKINKKNAKSFELFDSRGMCIYEGHQNEINIKILVTEYEMLQIKSRDNIEIRNIEVKNIPNEQKIVVIGDSTMTNQELPFWGWPQLLQARANIPTINYAISARSTKSFIEEGRLEYVKKKIFAGDILIIGFGHNDEKPNYFGTTPDEYIDNIKEIINQYEKLGVNVIVATPIARRFFVKGQLTETHGEYITKLKNELPDYIIDLNEHMNVLISYMGEERSKDLFVHSDLLKIYDDTHTSYLGASELCNYAIAEFTRCEK